MELLVRSLQPLANNLLVNNIRKPVEQSRYFPDFLRAGTPCGFLSGGISSWLHGTILNAMLHQFLPCHCDDVRAVTMFAVDVFVHQFAISVAPQFCATMVNRRWHAQKHA
jgi:hypothetical protein